MNIPSGLQHVMELYRLVRVSHRSRINAVKEIAKNRRIDPQTVTSACTRSLEIDTDHLDYFLLPKNEEIFCDHLVKRFPSYQKEIETFFNQIVCKKDVSAEDPSGVVRTLFPKERKDLLRSLLLQNISKKIAAWSVREDIPDDIMSDMLGIKKQIDVI
jgi:hypothetical protein